MRHVIDCAVSLDFLLNFARNVPDGYSTSEVVRHIILPSTSADRCRYVALPTVPPKAVGRSHFFISHRWAADFTRELVALVVERFAEVVDVRNASAGCQTVVSVSQDVAQSDMAVLTSSKLLTPDGQSNIYSGEISGPIALAATPASLSGIQASFSPTSPYPAGPLDDPPALDLPLLTISLPRPSSNFSAVPPLLLHPSTSLAARRSSSRLRAGNNILPNSNDSNDGFPIQTMPSPTAHRTNLQRSWTASAAGGLWLRDASFTSANSSATAAAAATAPATALVYTPGLLPSPPLPGAVELPATPEPPTPNTSFSGSLNPLHARPSSRPQELMQLHLPPPHPHVHQTQPLQSVQSVHVLGSALSHRSYRSERSFHSAGSGGGWGPSPGGGGDGKRRQGLGQGQHTQQQQPRGPFNAVGSPPAAPAANSSSVLGSASCLPSRLGSQQGMAATGSLPASERGTLPPSGDSAASAAAAAGVCVCAGGGRELAAAGGSASVLVVGAAAAGIAAGGDGGGGGGGGGRGGGITARFSTSEASDAATGEGTALAASLGSSTTTTSQATAIGSCSRAGSSTYVGVGGGGGGGGCGGIGSCGLEGVGAGAVAAGQLGVGCGSATSALVTGMQQLKGSHGVGGAEAGGKAAGLDWDGSNRAVLAPEAVAASNVEVVNGLLARFKDRQAVLEETYVWLDIFAINQHPDTTQADELQEVVRASEATLLVLDQGGLVLTRIWCLYEIWQTVQRKGPKSLQVLAGPLDLNQLAHVWGQLDAEQAQATMDADRVRILSDIRATTGVAELNRQIKKAIVESACHDLDVSRANRPRSYTHASAAQRAAHLLRIAGSGSAALAAAREAADVFGGWGGRTHGDTLQALRTVATCHKDLGATSMALGLMQQQVIPHLETAYGPGHTQYEALYDAGMMQYTLSQYDNAYNSLLMVLSQQLRQLHAAAPHATSQLAAVLATGPLAAAAAAASAVAAGRVGLDAVQLQPLSAEQLTTSLASFRVLVADVAPAASECVVGDSDPSGGGGQVPPAAAAAGIPSASVVGRSVDGVAGAAERVGLTLHSLGLVQRERAQRGRSAGWSGLLREARELMEGSVALLDAFSGAIRGTAGLDARAHLAELLMAGGEYMAAERLLRANLSLTESVYGGDHSHTATALNNLAMCLKRQRSSAPSKASEALSLYRRCLAVCSAALGEAHPETLRVATNLGVLLADQRQWSESERLLSRAVAALPGQLGATHPDALAAHMRLAEVLELRNKLFEAEALFRITLQYAESSPPGSRDHGLVLECKEGLARMEETLTAAARAQSAGACCIVS